MDCRVKVTRFNRDLMREIDTTVLVSEAVPESVKRASSDAAGALETLQAEVDFLARMNGLLLEVLVYKEAVSVSDLRRMMGYGLADSRIRRANPAGPISLILDLTYRSGQQSES